MLYLQGAEYLQQIQRRWPGAGVRWRCRWISWIDKEHTCPSCIVPFEYKTMKRTTTLQQDLNAAIAANLVVEEDEDDEEDGTSVIALTNSAAWKLLGARVYKINHKFVYT